MENSLSTRERCQGVLNSTPKIGYISSRSASAGHVSTMPPRRKLSLVERGQALAWIQDGNSKREVARRLQVSISVIVRLTQRHRDTGSVQERVRSGRPKKTDAREDRFIARQALQARTRTANVIRRQLREATTTNISEQTVRRRLHAANMKSRRPSVRPRLTRHHRAARLEFCRRHERWRRHHWAQVLFSDESRFTVHHNDGRLRVWRRQGERFRDVAVQEKVPYGGGSVMVWAAFSLHTRTPLHRVEGNLTGQRYRDEIVQPLVLPALQQIGQQAVFQDDNARPHTARVVQDFLRESGVNRMDWPACSPDLNPIENLWDILNQRIRNNHPPARDVNHVWEMLQEEWRAIPQRVFTNLVNSMRRRCLECQQNRGGHTHY